MPSAVKIKDRTNFFPTLAHTDSLNLSFNCEIEPNMREIFLVLLGLVSSKKPNVIVLLADDLGFDDMPWNNPDIIVQGSLLLFFALKNRSICRWYDI